MKLRNLLLLAFFLGVRPARALDLYAWQTQAEATPILLPVETGTEPLDAARKYVAALGRSAATRRLKPEVDFDSSIFKKLSSVPANAALVVMNASDHFYPGNSKVQNVVDFLAAKKSFLLPPIADAHLRPADARELVDAIARLFPLLVSVGGDDVHPATYGERSRYAQDTLLKRDEFELKVVSRYLEEGHGFFMGICRGAQLGAVALGYHLYQDIPRQVEGAISHAGGEHPITLAATSNNLFKGIFRGQKQITVNGWHHQSVRFESNPRGELEVAARTEDGVVEAMELRNGRGLLVQFHPEFMSGEIPQKIFRAAQRRAVAPAGSCRRILGEGR